MAEETPQEEEEKTEEEKAQEAAQAEFEAATAGVAALGLLAARVGDPHVCPMVDGVKPHVGGPILPGGVPNVLILGMPAANVGTQATCVGPTDVIIKGSATVFIGGLPAARVSDQTAHGGMIVMGALTVLIGG